MFQAVVLPTFVAGIWFGIGRMMVSEGIESKWAVEGVMDTGPA